MFIIRNSQFERLEGEKKHRRIKRLTAEIAFERAGNPDVPAGESLAERVRRAVARAEAESIRSANGLLRFARLGVIWGDGFADAAKTPWAAQILSWPAIPEEARLAELESFSDYLLEKQCALAGGRHG